MTELTARNLSTTELARALESHPDAGVRELAKRVIEESDAMERLLNAR